ncbi:hypothetical protein EGW08_015379 [Elysia chlorotica]|uniref:Uncharacterized protein n=1 Tax=Elysia chlorotica TaxID=188477 RepID=A0A3S1BBN7_ELYCH|nr:hypothetical protein EGW08_015379 [Elysia chlorotica]
MGTCYSKSGAGASLSPPENAPRARKRLSWRMKRRDREGSSISREGDFASGLPDSSPHKTKDLTAANVNSAEADPLLAEKQADGREGKAENSSLQATVAPSDSGIESIGTTQEDSQDQRGSHQVEEIVELKMRRKDTKITESARAEESDSSSDNETSVYLSRQLQRLSRGSCHKCGNFKLDDSALTALLADSYCICGPRRAGRPSVNPECQTHGLRHQRSNLSSQVDSMPGNEYNSGDHMGSVETSIISTQSPVVKCSENVPRKSSLKKRLSFECVEDRTSLSMRGSLKTEYEPVLNCTDSFDDVFEDEAGEDRESNADLRTHLGSLEKSLEKFPLSAHKRKSLLSEILDITDSICRCDFYSNEIFCSSQDPQESDEDISRSVQCVTSATTAHQKFPAESVSKSSPALYSPLMKKGLGSAKNVSFAMENTPKSFSTSNSSQSSIKGSRQNGAPSSSYGGLKSNLERLPSVDSTEMIVLSGSDSEGDEDSTLDSPEENGHIYSTEGCRKTLSYSSVQHLVGNSRELSIPVDSARRMFVDGRDSIVIPTEVYCQLEADLSVMKEQLLFLTSLMLEENEEETSLYDTDVMEESFA